jgi:hypothetical protein
MNTPPSLKVPRCGNPPLGAPQNALFILYNLGVVFLEDNCFDIDKDVFYIACVLESLGIFGDLLIFSKGLLPSGLDYLRGTGWGFFLPGPALVAVCFWFLCGLP